MVEQRICSFCGSNIEPGTGRIFVRKDGLISNFCGSKCYKNLVVMGRLPRETRWTAAHKREKEVRMAPTEGSKRSDGKAAEAKKVRKVARTVKATEKVPAEEKKEAAAKTEGADK